MKMLGLIVFVILAAVAALHVAWGLGLRWPATDERGLVATVVGATGCERMPGLAQCVLAATAILGAGIIVLMLSGAAPWPLPAAALTALGALVTVVFAGRGAVAYTRAWRTLFSLQPFARYDQIYYAPLCLAVALVSALLVFERMRN